MDISAKFVGFEDLAKQMQAMTTLAKDKQLTQNALFYASKPMFDEIKANAPKAEKAYYRYYRGSSKSRLAGNAQSSRKLIKPGTLKRSIARKRVRIDGSVGVGIYIKPKAWYYRFAERGTPRFAAKPFVRPAYEKYKADSVERFKEKYSEYIQNIKNRQKPG